MLEQILGWRLRDRLFASYLMVILITIVVIGIIVG